MKPRPQAAPPTPMLMPMLSGAEAAVLLSPAPTEEL